MDFSESLKNFMNSKGLPLFDELIINNKIIRYSSRDNKDKDEWYVINEIEKNKFICIFSSWRIEEEYVWRSYDQKEISDESFKLQLIQEEIIKEKQLIEKEQIKNTVSFWNTCNICLEHSYLERKKIQSHNLKIKGETLLIPMFNMENKLTSLQFINSEGKKRFKAGISTKYLNHILGDFDKSNNYIVCEGFATGASIYENTNIPVVIAFSASNCLMVGKAFQVKYPEKTGALAVDNDKKGLETLDQWKKYINRKFYIPTKENADFNDLYNDLGKETVNKIFKPKSFTAKNIAEILKEDIEEEKWYNSILSEGSFNIIYGDGGVGKSRIAYEMAFCLCANLNFLYFEPKQQCKILYVDGEMTANDVKKRLQELIDRYEGIEFDENIFKPFRIKDVFEQENTDLNLFNEEHRKMLEPLIYEADVIFLDNFGMITTPPNGDTYKLDTLEWIKLFKWIKQLKELKKTIVMIMHANKSGKLQGVGQIRNDADLVLKIKQPIDLCKKALCHFEVCYEKARKIPIINQKSFSAKLLPDRKLYFGWLSQYV